MKIRKQHIWIFIVVAVLVFTALSLGQGTVTIKGQGKYTNFFDGVLSLPEYANPEIYVDQQDHPDIPYYKIESMVLDRKDGR